MRMTLSFLAPAAIALGLLGAAGAYAQSAAPAPDSRQAKVESRIRDMYATLQITKAQDAAWSAFAQVMMDNAEAMEATAKQSGGDRGGLTAPQILDNYAAVSAQHAQNVARLSAAMEVLYADLSPEQKSKADEMYRARAKK